MSKNSHKKVIIIGASSGMGRELAKLMAARGYTLGFAAPQHDLLATLQQEIPSKTYTSTLDVRDNIAPKQL